jgi:putative ABC transport system permease protein
MHCGAADNRRMLTLAFRNVFRQKVRTGLTLAAIGLGVAGLILTGGFIEDVLVQLREATIHSQLGHIQIHKAGYSTLGRRDPYRYMMSDARKVVELASARPGVTSAMTRVEFSALLNNGHNDQPVFAEGIEPDREARLGTLLSVVDGRALTDQDRFAVALGQGVASGLSLKPGDYVTLLASMPEGGLNSLDLEVVGTFRSFSKEYDDRAIRLPLVAAQTLLATGGAHAVVVALDDTEQTDAVLAGLRAALPGGDYEVAPWYEIADFYQKTVELYRGQFGVLQLIVLVMVVLGVANSVNTTLYERTGEFGTMLALGNRRRDIFRLAMTENLILGLVGSALGGALGVGIAWAVSAVGIPMPALPNSELGYTAMIRVSPALALTAMGIGTVATVFAAILPARRATRLQIAAALRENA